MKRVMITRTVLKILFTSKSFSLCNTELVVCFSQFFPLHYIDVTTFSIELENLEHMEKNFKTHQNEYRQDCADELGDQDSSF